MNSMINALRGATWKQSKGLCSMLVVLLSLLITDVASAEEATAGGSNSMDPVYWGICLVAALTALTQAYLFSAR